MVRVGVKVWCSNSSVHESIIEKKYHREKVLANCVHSVEFEVTAVVEKLQPTELNLDK